MAIPSLFAGTIVGLTAFIISVFCFGLDILPALALYACSGLVTTAIAMACLYIRTISPHSSRCGNRELDTLYR